MFSNDHDSNMYSTVPSVIGVAGLYDFGPMGCAMKANLLSIWRSHFVLEENMLEVDCTMLTPDPVLRASGHVERFSDYMVKDLVTGECFRADHLLEDNLERLAADPKCSQDKIKEYKDVIAKVGYVTKVGGASLSFYCMQNIIVRRMC